MADAKIDPTMPAIVAQDAMTVGDDKLDVRPVEVTVFEDESPAQVSQPRTADAPTVHVHEVSVSMDRVITDPSDPLAVQIPDAGRGSLDLPIHALGGDTPEDVFKRDASKPTKAKS